MSRPEPDPIALQSWHYPTNNHLETDQFNIIESCLDSNSLIVVNETKTRSFIGHVIMYNYGRWFPANAKFIFMALNKSQLNGQVELFRSHVECNVDELVELSGGMIPSIRETLWRNKKFFFATPQVLFSDLINGSCPTNQIALILIDDAHLAVGRHAYCEVIDLIRKSQESPGFRIVALSPMVYSSTIDINKVVDSLKISTVKFRSDESLRNCAICKYVVEPSQFYSEISTIFRNEFIGSQIQKLMLLIPTWEIGIRNLGLAQLGELRQCFLVDVSLCQSKEEAESCLDVLEALLHFEKKLLSLGIEALWSSLTLLNLPIKENSKVKLRSDLEKSPCYHRLKEMIQFERSTTSFCPNSKLSCVETKLLEHLRDSPGDRIIVISEHQENSVHLLSALRRHSPAVKPMQALPNPSAKQKSESLKTFSNGGYNVLIISRVDAEEIEACKANLVFFLEVPQQYSASTMMIGCHSNSSLDRVIFAVYKGEEEKRFDSYLEQKALLENILAKSEKSIVLHRNHWRTLPTPPVCIKRIFSLHQAKTNIEPKKRKSEAVKSIAGFEKVTSEMIAASPDLSMRHSGSTDCWFLVRPSRRNEDLDLLLKDFDRKNSSTQSTSDQNCFRLDIFMENWRNRVDPDDLKNFLVQSRNFLCGDVREYESPKDENLSPVPSVRMNCAIEELPDTFFDDPYGLACPAHEYATINHLPPPVKLVSPTQDASYATWLSKDDQDDASPFHFQGKNTRICYSSVKPTQIDSTPGNALGFFLDTQAGISDSDRSDTEHNLSTVGSFICSGETDGENSPNSQMLGFYRQSLFQSQPWAGFKDGAIAYKSEPAKKKSKTISESVIEISESASDDFLEGSDLDWDAIENNIL